jgi:hypothetical protein
MNKHSKKRYASLLKITLPLALCGLISIASAEHPLLKNEPKITDQMPIKNEMIVAYYGRPGVSSLGVLGKYPIGKLKSIIKTKVAQYKKATGNHNIVPAFDIIYGLASSEPGRHKDYIIHLNSKKLDPYIKAAEQEGFNLFIDTQLGKHTPQDAIHHMLKYLKHHNVHIALDPEFEVSNLEVRPGKKIGHITGEWINKVQAIMDKYMKENGIKEKKMLVVHMFRHGMVTSKSVVKHYKNIDLIMNLDGHGSPKLKIGIYNAIYSKLPAQKVAGRFKLFFNEDHPMMTPRQVMGLESVQGAKIKYPPKFINYQ